MYRIGIIDDAESERADIQVSVLDNAGWDAEIEFKEYELETRTREDIVAEIRRDVEEGNIHALIVDFKLDTTADVIKGWEIIEFMHEETPEFPVVIMTNAPDESKESQYTDADKVYAKKVFLRPELEATKELVKNIVLNMEKYVSRRKELEARLEIELKKLDRNGASEDALKEVIRIENELSRYKQIYQTRVDKALDLSDLKDAFEELEKYEKLLG
ncbi:hypothetical protein [uncultured Acetatifactor sp.]|mgnify:FL=1|uniref:hypothetical protein n=1 Tax=uncultured Acetatifactor sp. TaxID=1671927 RepID=UPI00262DD68B|nr:hypothetical protein [uncultured Acetatifactor sp.]